MNKYGQIYRITNKVNNKVYIGLTIRKNVLHDRYRGSLLSTHNDHLKKSINKYGKENFKIETLCWCNSEEELCNKEIEYIAYYNSTNSENGYNKNEGGVTGNGAIVSDETKILIGKKSKIAWDSNPERRKNLAESMKGDNNFLVKMGGHTPEAKEKMKQIKLKGIKEGKIDLRKARGASLKPEAIRKRVKACSKFWFIQYDLDFNELNRWHTLKDMHTYSINENLEVVYSEHINSNVDYRIFRLLRWQKKIFNENGYKGFYWRKIGK